MILLAFMSLFRNVRRTIAILLTIAMGAGVLFSFEGFIQGVLGQYRENTIHALYGHGQINTKDYRETVYADPWNHWIENAHQLREYILSLNYVKNVFFRVNFPAFLKNGNITVSASGQGIEALKEADFFYSLNIEQGKPLEEESEGILLGRGLANALNVSPGDKVTVVVNSVTGKIQSSDVIVTRAFS